jgi:hypothetical protein
VNQKASPFRMEIGKRYLLILKIVNRLYHAFDFIDKGKRVPLGEFDIRDSDIALSFFVFCYHLKDWIEIDYPAEKKNIEYLIDSTRLKYCADLCNGIKHLERRDKPRSGKQPEIIGSRITFCIVDGEERLRDKFQISTDEGELDAFDLATECMNIWLEFIRGKIDPKISEKIN